MQNKTALYLLLLANSVSGFAQGISMISIPWYFTDVLQQSSLFGLIYAITTALTLFWGLYAGTLIDKYPRKNIFLALCISGAIVLIGVSLVGFITGNIPVYLAALVFTYTILNYNIHFPTLYAFGQEISEKKNYGRINSFLEVNHQTVSVLSGGAAALLLGGISNSTFGKISFISEFTIEPWSLHEIFLLDGLTYCLSFFLVLLIKYKPIEDVYKSSGNVLERLKEGFLFLKENPLLFLFGNASYVIFLVLLVTVHQLVPMYIANHLKEGGEIYASTEMIYAIGALAAGIWINRLLHAKHTLKAIIVLMLLTVFVYVWCSFTKATYVLFITSIVLGLTNAGTRILRITYLFHHIPNHIIGRAGSVFQAINVLFRLLLILIFSMPFFASGSNITWAYFICGIVVFAWALPLLFYYKRLQKEK
ncbi:MAG: MFS transporter [Bacteroidetes bacterium]|nr:MFS transporter [Bacteroidota bacterium]MBV6461044.1 hypothetical protein [Flavobacteriales bacterium]WKZ75558.1 MAG: MFS transporter [Vicingaceae bacterium]MCL4815124.1 MFS transporter [Flavobacteriales bacterium]NOG94466.1 MFS transporter [Bacteroidota bacterium]